MDQKNQLSQVSNRSNDRHPARGESVWRSMELKATFAHGNTPARMAGEHLAVLQTGVERLRNARGIIRRYTESERNTASMMLNKLKCGDDLRAGKVEDIRSALQNEDYENDFKLDVAVERLLNDLRSEGSPLFN